MKLKFLTLLILLCGCSSAPKIDTSVPPGPFDPKTALLGFSHINVVVDDVEKATEFYGRTLGFEQAHNKDGKMDYTRVDIQTFARSAGFLDGKPVLVHVRFLVHPRVRVFLELMKYHEPKGSAKLPSHRVNDIGGIRHAGFEVADAVATFNYLKQQPDVKFINPSPKYGPPELLGPVAIKFFYWVDPWGVVWEIEEGRPIGHLHGTSG